jgi:hypothetical protein
MGEKCAGQVGRAVQSYNLYKKCIDNNGKNSCKKEEAEYAKDSKEAVACLAKNEQDKVCVGENKNICVMTEFDDSEDKQEAGPGKKCFDKPERVCVMTSFDDSVEISATKRLQQKGKGIVYGRDFE